MKTSLIQSVRQCYVCSALITEKHHIYYGTANRSKADEDGCWVWLCPAHHRGEHGVHGCMGSKLKLSLQRKCQLAWCQTYHKGTEDFIKRYGHNYLAVKAEEENKEGWPYA